MTKYFGTDGIRGKVGELITPTFALQLGRAMHVLSGDRVVIAFDTRESSITLAEKLAEGLKEIGKNVIIAGIIPTPGLAYYSMVHQMLGVMITASHNPYTDNGFKIFSNGLKLQKSVEMRVEEALINGVFPKSIKSGELLPVNPSPFTEYASFLEQQAPTSLPFSFGCDFGYGATYLVGKNLFGKLYPSHFKAFSYKPDGHNINNHVGALHPTYMANLLQEYHLDFGFSFDGDGDRIIMTDHSGRVYDGDDILYLLAVDLKSQSKLTHNRVACTVMSNLGIINALRQQGISVEITDVGDSNVLASCLDQGLAVGAEASGHIMIPSLLPGGDGLLIAIQLLKYLSRVGKTPAEVLSNVQRYPEVLINVHTSDKAVAKHPRVLEKVAQIKNEINQDGKVFVRASGTEPLLRITVSAPMQTQVDRYALELKQLIESLAEGKE